MRTPQVRKDRSKGASAAPARRRQRQSPTAASEEQDARKEHGDPPVGSATAGLYQDCCGRVYARSVYRIEVLDELMLDGLRLAELRGSATYATVTSAVNTSAVTIADVVAAAGAAAQAANALDRARAGSSGVEQACHWHCSFCTLSKALARDWRGWAYGSSNCSSGLSGLHHNSTQCNVLDLCPPRCSS